LRFGWAVDWSPHPLINGRQESLRQKAIFCSALERRVVVPAAFYVEWRAAEGGQRRKQALRIGPPDGGDAPLWMAALWDGDEAFCVITTPAQGPAAEVHHRMPVLLTHDQACGDWLSAKPYSAVADLVESRAPSPVAAGLTVSPLGGRQRTVGDANGAQGQLF
jgi:putative SOS response-associated peptidase YedK